MYSLKFVPNFIQVACSSRNKILDQKLSLYKLSTVISQFHRKNSQSLKKPALCESCLTFLRVYRSLKYRSCVYKWSDDDTCVVKSMKSTFLSFRVSVSVAWLLGRAIGKSRASCRTQRRESNVLHSSQLGSRIRAFTILSFFTVRCNLQLRSIISKYYYFVLLDFVH